MFKYCNNIKTTEPSVGELRFRPKRVLSSLATRLHPRHEKPRIILLLSSVQIVLFLLKYILLPSLIITVMTIRHYNIEN